MTQNALSLATMAAGLILVCACNKNSSTKTIYDTVTLTKTDTVRVAPPIDTPNLTSGLVFYLPFTNGSMADSSGGGNTVTSVGGGGAGYDMHGDPQSSFSGDGNGQYLVVGNNGYYALDTAFSISLDFMIKAVPVYNGIGVPGLEVLASMSNPANGNGAMLYMGMGTPGAPQYLTLGLNPSTDDCNTVIGPTGFVGQTTFEPQVGSWYNVILTFSSGAVNLYINGQLSYTATAQFQQVIFCSSGNLVIGGWWSGDPESIDGEITQFRLYNKSLSSQQITWLARNFQANKATSHKPGLRSFTPSILP